MKPGSCSGTILQSGKRWSRLSRPAKLADDVPRVDPLGSIPLFNRLAVSISQLVSSGGELGLTTMFTTMTLLEVCGEVMDTISRVEHCV